MSCFIDEITPSLHTLSKENSYSILEGDFKIDFLKLNERHIFSTFFDSMCSSGFFPHITVPTRFATTSCSLIDQIYITSSGVVISNISDHLPCFTSICILQTKTTPPKFIIVNTRSETAINNFKEGLKATLLQSHLNTFLRTKTIRFNKYKHRIKSWMTENILRSIKFRDKWYKQYLSKSLNSTEKVILKSNLRVFKDTEKWYQRSKKVILL